MSSESDLALNIEDLGKRYLVSPKAGDAHGPMERLKMRFLETFPQIAPDASPYWFWPLRHANIRVNKGESVGIIGSNGSGKSTLLKLIAGVTLPSEGSLHVTGSVGALLEVGTGFHPDMSGRDNVFMSGALLGVSRKIIKARFSEIVAFAGLEKFIDTPVKRYSSGMYVRLAFATASLLRAEIMILDEVMAVGDAEFRQRSEESLGKASGSGSTILFVSHNMEAIRKVCSRVIVLRNGHIEFDGEAETGIAHYLRSLHLTGGSSSQFFDPLPIAKDLTDAPRHELTLHQRSSTGDLREVITGVQIQADHVTSQGEIVSDSSLRIVFDLQGEPRKNSYLSVFFHNLDGTRACTIYSTHCRVTFDVSARATISTEIRHLPLAPGTYSLMIDFGEIGDAGFTSIDCVKDAARVKVVADESFGFPTGLPNQGSLLVKSHWTVVSGAVQRSK